MSSGAVRCEANRSGEAPLSEDVNVLGRQVELGSDIPNENLMA